jgi:hypothetical protein
MLQGREDRFAPPGDVPAINAQASRRSWNAMRAFFTETLD